MLGIRARLFVVAVVVITVVDLLVGLYLEHQLRETLRDELRVEVTRHARTASALAKAEPRAVATEAVLDRVADAAGAASGARITFIRTGDGRVLGDSELTLQQLATMEDHSTRPEVIAALDQGAGTATRVSATVDRELMYAAVPMTFGESQLVARASLPIKEVDAMVGRLRAGVAMVGLLAIAVAAVVLAVVASHVTRTLQPVMTQAVAAAEDAEATRDPPTQSLRGIATDLESVMATLAAERNRFRAVLQTMDQAVLALDADQRVTTVNRSARSLLSLESGVEGRRLLEAVRSPGLRKLVEDAEEGQARQSEFDLPGGKRVEGRATRHSDGAVVIAMVDVSEIRRLERVRRDFVANVSHELRTPISVIKATAETLLSGGLEDERAARMFVEAMLRHSDRLGRLVADLLDISRIEAGRYPLTLSKPVLVDVVEQVVDAVDVEARKKEVELAVNVSGELRVVADRKALEQVLINLVSNAVKYTPEGGHVEVTASSEGGVVRVEVRDDGPGVDPAHRARIFERFYRADPGRSREMGGTGLGLSIVKHLVEAMNGEVGVDARSPHGSVFWFTLSEPSPKRGQSAANEPPQSDDRSGSAVS